jgi:hypothetical protein
MTAFQDVANVRSTFPERVLHNLLDGADINDAEINGLLDGIKATLKADTHMSAFGGYIDLIDEIRDFPTGMPHKRLFWLLALGQIKAIQTFVVSEKPELFADGYAEALFEGLEKFGTRFCQTKLGNMTPDAMLVVIGTIFYKASLVRARNRTTRQQRRRRRQQSQSRTEHRVTRRDTTDPYQPPPPTTTVSSTGSL